MSVAGSTVNVMTVREHTAIRLAAMSYRYPGRRDTDVHRELSLSPVLFWRLIHSLLDRPDVLAAYPLEVRRLTRLRDARRQARSA